MAGTSEEKARGAFYTPASIAGYLASWAIRHDTDTVLEPSCGDAEFLSAAADRLNALGGPRHSWDGQLHGVEIHPHAAAGARQRMGSRGASASIIVEDFFLTGTARRFDVVIGNPPFIRYQDFSGLSRSRSLEAALAQGVRLSGLASSWAAFVVKAAQHLVPGGRLALVLPAELLTVGYAAEVRRFLLRRFAQIRLVTFEERVFPGVLEDVVLLLAEGSGGTSHFQLHQTRSAASLAEASAGWTSYAPVSGEKWTPALVASEAFAAYRTLASEACEGLGTWGRTYLGSVTGNNAYFSLTDAEAVRHGFGTSDLIRISPPGSRHLRGLEFSDAAWRGLGREGAKAHLFYPAGALSVAARAYIARGEAGGVSTAYKCRVRSPWWRVPMVEVPDLFLTYMNHDRPRLVTNTAGVRVLNSLYGVKLEAARHKLGMELLPLASLNSVTLLGAEIVGRSYGGGLLKLEPREADHLPVPSFDEVAEKADQLRAARSQLNAALRQNNVGKAASLIDPILFPRADSSALDTLRTAREILFQRRRARGGNGTDR